MKSYILDNNWSKVVSGEMTIEEWMNQAASGPEIDVTEEELEEALSQEKSVDCNLQK